MTKKHFETFARDIRNAAETESIEARRFAACVIIRTASLDNVRFNTDRFLRACGLTPW